MKRITLLKTLFSVMILAYILAFIFISKAHGHPIEDEFNVYVEKVPVSANTHQSLYNDHIYSTYNTYPEMK